MSDLPLAKKRFLIFVDDIYEDLELWYPKLRLIEAGGQVTVAGPQAEHVYHGKHSYPCRADAAIAQQRAADFDGLVVPGGFMPDKLRRDPHVLQLVRDFAAAGKLVAAICHGGWIPISAGVYRGVRVTGSPGIKDDLVNAGAAVERRAGGDRSALRVQPQARRSARLLPRHFGSDGRFMSAAIAAFIDPQWIQTVSGVVAVPLLLMLNAFFVAAEFSLVSVRRTRVDEMVNGRLTGAVAVKTALDNLDDMIAVTQLGITLASLGLGWVGEPCVARVIQPAAGRFCPNFWSQPRRTASPRCWRSPRSRSCT